ncbi:MAG: tetratricopeptide repeat protein, partial [Deltaproteobacteria bacterium]|nr:tetratricopeptide repeat protein [Deltaproteobacteria bacterium]
MSTALEAEIQSPRLEKAILLMESKNFEEAEIELKMGIDESQSSEDVVMEAIYQSTLGVLHKLKKDYKMAWKYYENAERLLPHDPALKIISARLLVDIFGQYDTAIKKMEKVLKLVQDDQPFIHQAYTVMGLAYLKKGDRKKALTCFQDSMKDDFQKMITAQNIDS